MKMEENMEKYANRFSFKILLTTKLHKIAYTSRPLSISFLFILEELLQLSEVDVLG